MGVRVPQNQIITSKYTSGNEYVYEKTYDDYQGYYYEFGDKTFAGREFSIDAPVIVKITSININFRELLKKLSSQLLGRLGTDLLTKEANLPSVPLDTSQSGTKYFAKQLNTSPVKIICVTEEVYNENKSNNSLYSFTSIILDGEFGFIITKQNKKDIPEIEEFLKSYSNNTGT